MSTTGNSSGRMAIASVMPARKPLQPVATREAVDGTTTTTHSASPRIASSPDQPPVSRCSRVPSGCDRLQGLADLAHFGARAGGAHLGDALALDDQRARRRRTARSRRRAASTLSARRPRRTLRTGTDSPVSSDSSVVRLVARGARHRPARGRLRPARSGRRGRPRGPRCASARRRGSRAREGWTGRAGPRAPAPSFAPGRA